MQLYPTSRLSIKQWAEADRPREKLLLRGRKALSDAELLAILLGTGNAEISALSLAQQILASVEHNLHQLGKTPVKELCSFKGIGKAKAVTIAAALELGRRRQLSVAPLQTQITCSQDAFQLIAPVLIDLPREEFWILLLNRANRVIAKEQISTGGVAGTVVDAKLIFHKALQHLACALILAHNHPSGNRSPSQADIDLTRKLKRAGADLDIQVLDHLIVTDQGYYSFADEGLV